MDIFSFLVLIFGRLIAYALCLSARFWSATVLPGNSEVIFVALAVPKLMLGSLFNADILALILIATAGNSLGSLTTYGIGRWMPKFDPKNYRTLWAINQLRRYGAVVLLLSWLPVVGDLFCAIAGWLRLNFVTSSLFIFLGKMVRYVALLF